MPRVFGHCAIHAGHPPSLYQGTYSTAHARYRSYHIRYEAGSMHRHMGGIGPDGDYPPS